MDFFCKAFENTVRIGTLGMVNLNDGEVKFKDPVRGTASLIKDGAKKADKFIDDNEEAIKAGIKGATFGTVNFTDGGLTFKDPVTGLIDIKKDIFQDNDFNQGVWLGYRPLDQTKRIGFKSNVLQAFNWNIMHCAVMIDGQVYHITNPSDRQYVQVQKCYDTDSFEWTYKGSTQRTSYQIQTFIKKINKIMIEYNLLKSNCQDFADGFYKWARRIYDEDEFFYFGLPKLQSTSDKIGHTITSFTGTNAYYRSITEGKNEIKKKLNR